jgi:neopullulanase
MKNKLNVLSIVLFSVFLCLNSLAQNTSVKRIDPQNWYVGMFDNKLQLLVYGDSIANSTVSLNKYAGVKLIKVNKVENPNYLFLDLEIDKISKPGFINFSFSYKKKVFNQKYELKARSNYKTKGVDASDFIYLAIPDRFSNGDTSNDSFANMADPNSDRSNPWLRHGGDLKGIENHLDYFTELGVTALWLNPVMENNQPLTNEGGQMRSAYHGYGITDFYNVDKRLGGNLAYKNLINNAHQKGIKIVQDAVYNHAGANHWFLNDKPMKSWLNNWDTYTNTTYKDQSIVDTHSSAYDKNVAKNGWFVPFLPDLNHSNPYVANYMIQNALWVTEYFGIDAWRIDTYFYNDLEFMNRCNKVLIDNFPKIHIFGENWVNSVANQAYFTQNNLNVPFKSNLPGSVDFQLYIAINAALNEKPGWNDGVQKLYQVLGQDYLYKDPNKLVTFLDNHDTDRIFSVLGEDNEKFKTSLIWLLTTRGIPQLYYGTEILMKNFKNPSDAEVRKDFPGGWSDDLVNKFKKEGRTPIENETFEFVKKLANYRKNSKALTIGKLTQFTPFDNGIYAYFRTSGNQKVMVISNISGEDKIIETSRFKEIFNNENSAFNVLTNERLENLKTIKLKNKETLILEVK